MASSPADVRDYWTKKRMREAEPVDSVTGVGRGDPRPLGARVPANLKDPSFVPPALPNEPARAGLTAGPAPTSGRVLGIGVDREEVADPSAPEVRMHGKVFFTSGDDDFVCSGTAINSRNRSVVWSAGHCVFDAEGGGFAANWIFKPGYREGVAPFGEWPARRLATTTGWQASANLRYDLGAAVVTKNASGQRLQEVVGGRGIGFDQPRDQVYEAFGYPASQPPLEFTGEREFRCRSMLSGTDQPVGPGPATTQIKCDMTAGSSGGGWIGGSTLLSVTSYGYLPEPDRLYGPYQSTSAKDLYRSVRGGKKRRAKGGKCDGRRDGKRGDRKGGKRGGKCGKRDRRRGGKR